MKRLTLLFTALACISGIGMAFAPVYRSDSQSRLLIHYDWYDINGQTVLYDIDRIGAILTSECFGFGWYTCLFATVANGMEHSGLRINGLTIHQDF